MKAMLLAAGRSSRLGALGQELPKPLVPVCGYPVIRFALAACARAGLADVVVNLHHRGDLIREALGDGSGLGVHISYSPEAELLGTAGGLAHARPLLGDGSVVVINAKVVADADLASVVAAHETSGADATLVVRDDPDARAWGAIASDGDGRVISILGEVGPRRARGSVVERMFTGIQVMGPAVLDRLQPVFSDSIRAGYIPALKSGADIRVVVLPGYFAEHSTPARYLGGNLALLRAPHSIAARPGPLIGIDAGARVDARAIVISPVRIDAGAVVEPHASVGPDVVVGKDAVVSAGAQVTRAVLWPGVRAEGTIADAVLTAEGLVPAKG